MPDNSGFHIGRNSGNIRTGSGRVTQTVQLSGDPRTASTIEHINQLLAALLAGTGQLSAESAEIVTGEATWLRNELHDGQLHARHVHHALDALAKEAAGVRPVMSVVNDVTDMVLRLLH